MKTKYVIISAVLIITAVILASITLIHQSRFEYKVIKQYTGAPLDFSQDIDFIIREAQSFGYHLPEYKQLSEDIVREAELVRVFLKDIYSSQHTVNIDFILNIHANSGPKTKESEEIAKIYDHNRSHDIVKDILVWKDYDIVSVEGGFYDSFSEETVLRELFTRIKYDAKSPSRAYLVSKGADFSSYERARGHIKQYIDLVHADTQIRWREIEKSSKASFIASEIPTIHIFQGMFVRGIIQATTGGEMNRRLHRIRSAYVVAKMIEELKRIPGGRGAIVFGCLHGDDFERMAGALGVRGVIYNATGLPAGEYRTKLP